MRIGEKIFQFEKWLAILLLGGIFVITFVQVVLRYVFNTGLTWVPEIAVFAFITLTLVGCSTGVISGVHVGVDVLVKKASPRVQKIFAIFANLCGVALYSFICYVCYEFVLYFKGMGQVSIVTEIPIWTMIIYMPVAFAFTAFHHLEILWEKIREDGKKETKGVLDRSL